MSEETRGHDLKRRRIALGIKSQHKMAKVAGEQGFELSRAAIMAAEQGKGSASTYDRYEALITRLEGIRRRAEAAGEGDVLDDDEDEAPAGVVEYRASGDFGVEFVVKGPSEIRDALKADLLDLLRELRGDGPSS